jgi:hypothetical protein
MFLINSKYLRVFIVQITYLHNFIMIDLLPKFIFVCYSAALDLLENYKVETIIGPQKSSQAIFISDLGTKSHVPIISFTATSPTISPSSLPYFVRATLNDSAQVSCIASTIKAYGWRKAVPIYEDTEYGRGIIPYLVDVLQEDSVHVPYRSVIPLSATSEQISKELLLECIEPMGHCGPLGLRVLQTGMPC